MKYYQWLWLWVCGVVGCLSAGVQVQNNIPYYPDNCVTTDYQRARCVLDVRYPDNKTNFPVVVWFHGGGLSEGSKHFIAIDNAIAQVSVNYRLLQHDGSVTGDTCIDDAAAAVAWTLKNIAKYGGDPKRVYVSGSSAGGYLTMMVGMDYSRLAKWGFKPTDLAGLIPLSGQATKHFNVRAFSGDKTPQFVPQIDRLAPLNFVGKDLPPILSVCGQPPYEWPGRAEENRFLVASCVAMGHTDARFVECPLCTHGRSYRAGVPYVEWFIKGELKK